MSAWRLSMFSIMKIPEYIVPACNLPEHAAVRAAEAAQQIAEAEVPRAAQAAQAPEGRPTAAAESARADPRRGDINDATIALRIVLQLDEEEPRRRNRFPQLKAPTVALPGPSGRY